MAVIAQPNINLAQTFFLDREAVQGATAVAISAVDLYFKFKPRATNNKSGITNPGVEMFIAETNNGVPRVYDNKNYSRARVEYGDILVSSDGSLATKFRFTNPINVQTDKEYALVVKYDGSEDFMLWVSRQGDMLVSSASPSPGPSGKFVGKYFEFSAIGSNQDFSSNNVTATTDAISTDPEAPGREVQGSWRALNDTDLKFAVSVCRYFVQGVPVELSTITNSVGVNIIAPFGYGVEYPGGSVPEVQLAIPFLPQEYVIFDDTVSKSNTNVPVGGVRVYQNTVFWPGGWANGASSITISVTANSNVVTANTNYPNGTAFSWSSVFALQSDQEYITIISLNDGGDRKTNIRRVSEIASNTVLHLADPVSITNAAAYFIKSPVAQITMIDQTKSFGQLEDIIVLKNSNANGTVHFVNNAIESANIIAGGSGFSNNDILYVKGFEDVATKVEGGYLAVANLVTNTSGGITAVYFSNVGSGFSITANIAGVFCNSTSNNRTSNTSAGTGANIAFIVTNTLRSEYQGDLGYYKNYKIRNLSSSIVMPEAKITAPIGTTHQLYHQSLFSLFNSNNTTSSNDYVLAANSAVATRQQVQPFKINYLTDYDPAVLGSYSNQFLINYANGSSYTPASLVDANANTALLLVNITSNNDFVSATIGHSPVLSYSQYIINNDYTDEHTDRGNAFAKHITTKVNFANNHSAEDLIVYLTAYKPQYTDIQVFARIINADDVQDEFDDKDWTRLELFGANNLSSAFDTTNFIELSYQFANYPNTQFSFSGYVTTSNNSTNVIGSNTTFNDASSNIVANDLVKIYSPLFPNNYMITVVNSVTNATHFTITDPITNNNILGSGLVVDKLQYKHQAFRNQLNDNVVRYYSSSMVPFDTYDTLALKVVMLSETPSIVPRIDNIRAIGVTS